ncbi:MAG: methionine/alanine import family NSS transporter small subunit [Actinomycetaceae bacterium]|nr:methionine/alanine import family NSS transporter small subunit [Actinomycetaceae bacterium]
MSPAALILLVVTIIVVWGGLVASAVALRTLPTPEIVEDDEPVGALTD